MADRRYRAAPAGSLRIVPLDDFSLVFHRTSGLTHLVTAPAPEILAALSPAPLTRDALLADLARDFDLADGDAAALDARLTELVAVGLVEML